MEVTRKEYIEALETIKRYQSQIESKYEEIEKYLKDGGYSLTRSPKVDIHRDDRIVDVRERFPKVLTTRVFAGICMWLDIWDFDTQNWSPKKKEFRLKDVDGLSLSYFKKCPNVGALAVKELKHLCEIAKIQLTP